MRAGRPAPEPSPRKAVAACRAGHRDRQVHPVLPDHQGHPDHRVRQDRIHPGHPGPWGRLGHPVLPDRSGLWGLQGRAEVVHRVHRGLRVRLVHRGFRHAGAAVRGGGAADREAHQVVAAW